MLILAILLAPTVDASSIDGAFDATRIDTRGDLDLTGEIVGLHIKGIEFEASHITLAADAMHITMDEHSGKNVATLASGRFDVTTRSEEYGPSTMDATWGIDDDDFPMTELFVEPMSGAGLTYDLTTRSDATIGQPVEEVLEAHDYVGNEHRTPASQSTRGALQVTPQVQAIRLTGDMHLSVWSWDLMIRTDDGEERFIKTGSDNEEIVDGADARYFGDYVDRQVYIQATNATLLLTGIPTEYATIVLRDIRAGLDGTFSAHGAQGSIAIGPDQVALNGSTFRSNGELRFALADHENAILSHLQGDVDRASLGARAITIPSPAGSQGPHWLMALAAAALVMPGLVVTGRHTQKRHQANRLDQLESAFDFGEYGLVLRHAGRLPRSKWFGVDATLLCAEAEIKSGNLEGARQRLDAPLRWTPAADASREYLMAVIAAKEGKHLDARKHLDTAIQAAPEIATLAREDNILASVDDAVPEEAYA